MNFKQLIKQQGYTEARLAVKLNCSRNTVCNWCSGRRTPSIENIKAISIFLNVDISEVVGSLLEREGK